MGRSTPNGKSFEIPKRRIVEAWEKVQANGGAPGVDTVSITDFASDVRTTSTSCGTG
jgi:RNA-directed DNA polymerase